MQNKFILITGMPGLIVLHFITLHRYCVYYKLKDCSNPESSRYIGPIFPKHLLTSCLHVTLVILTIFQTFSLLLYLLWWSVISDVSCYYCNCFGAPQIANILDSKLNKCVCSDCSTDWLFPSLPHLDLSIPSDKYWN